MFHYLTSTQTRPRFLFSKTTTLAILMFAGLLAPTTCQSVAKAEPTTQPNVVLILADDMGWGDPTCYNSQSKTPTPAIDSIAQQGIRFTDAHTPSAVCTPTRYGLLTGRYCWRSRLKSSVLDGFSPPLIESERTTIASMLRSTGYATACVGKWHLGMQWTRNDGTPESVDRAPRGFRPGDVIDFTKPVTAGPLTVGFDYFYGISASLDMPPYCWINQDRCEPIPSSTVPTAKNTIFLNQTGGASDPNFKLHDVLPTLKQRATDWIIEHCDNRPEQPFFLYLPLNSPHLPVAPSDPFSGKSGAGDYGDFVVETDDCIGAVLATLENAQQSDNTIVIFTSDNGGLWHQWEPAEADDVQHYKPTPRAKYTADFQHYSNAHLRGTKADIWEGGHRVPFVAQWPKKIRAGQVCDHLIELNDLPATIARWAGCNLPAGAAEDSIDQSDVFMGATKPARTTAVHHSLRGNFALRSGKWKYMPDRGSGGFSHPRTISTKPNASKPNEPIGQLYDLNADPSETKNLWSSQRKVVRDMTIKLGDIVEPLNRQTVRFESTADGTTQEAILIMPDGPLNRDIPLVVSLHSWSANLRQRNTLEWLVNRRGWIYLFPNFRGVNQRPEACGSTLAQQDILDAIDFVCENHRVDEQQIFLTGTSGGGHMTMLMSARYPERFRAASAWVGISDLATWHQKHAGTKYGNMLEQVCGGRPGVSKAIDEEYKTRSPLTWMSGAKGVAIDLSAGIDDGHLGSVPIRHSIDAFNLIAKANGTEPVTEKEISELSQQNGRLAAAESGDEGFDLTFARKFYLRRKSKQARLTIFDGGHEGIASATMAWFERHAEP